MSVESSYKQSSQKTGYKMTDLKGIIAELNREKNNLEAQYKINNNIDEICKIAYLITLKRKQIDYLSKISKFDYSSVLSNRIFSNHFRSNIRSPDRLNYRIRMNFQWRNNSNSP